MQRLTFIITASLLLITITSSAQDYSERFASAFQSGDSAATVQVLGDWKKVKPNDPERYVALYNYYVNKALREVIALQPNASDSKALTLKDSTGKEVAYLGGQTVTDPVYLKKALACIDEAIVKFPRRLDMRFGKCYLLEKTGNYASLSANLVNAINYGSKVKYKWQWKNGEALEDPTQFMLSTIQTYLEHTFNSGEENIKYIKPVAQTALKYFPDHVESLSNLAVTYMIGKDYKNALPYLLHAEKISKNDYVVLNNIAYCYFMMDDKPNAIKYYRLVYQYGDEGSKNKALQFLNKLGQ